MPDEQLSYVTDSFHVFRCQRCHLPGADCRRDPALMNLRYAGTVLLICCRALQASRHRVLIPSIYLPKNVIHKYPLPHATSAPSFMATGSDKNVWFTEQRAARIGKIRQSGVVTAFAIPSVNK